MVPVGMPGLVLAVDGGNSKTDVLLVDATGRLLAAGRGGSISHQAVGIEEGMARLSGLVSEVADLAGRVYEGGHERRLGHGRGVDGERLAAVGVYCLAGADFPRDVRLLRDHIGRLGLARTELVLNDCYAALRAGARQGYGVALICGQGINGAGVAPDGRVARFAAVGSLSGDWGGATSLGEAALGAAIRARDGRGSRTSLERAVPAHFRLARPEALMLAMYEERIPERRLSELSPVVFAAAEAGDGVARAIVEHLADELALMAVALLRRLGMLRRWVEVVLAGGVFRTRDDGFYQRLASRVHAAAPRAQLVRLDAPPVLGAALLGLDQLAQGLLPRPDDEAAMQLRADVERWSAAR